MLTSLIILAAGLAAGAIYWHNRSLAKHKAILRDRLNRLAAADGPKLALERFQRSLARARREEAYRAMGITPGVARVQVELDEAEWEGGRAR